MYVEDLIHDAIDVVLSQDVPEEAFGEAVQAQATLMAGAGSD